MRLSKRTARVLKQLIVISLCVTVAFAIWLLNRVNNINVYPKFFTGNNFTLSPAVAQQISKKFESLNRTNVLHSLIVKKNRLKITPEIINVKIENKTEVTTQVQRPIKLEMFGVGIDDTEPCYNVHTFYYPWYGNPEHDRKYIHWNHAFLPHWNKQTARHWPQGRHNPPDDIGANFYPMLGPYSSGDPAIVDKHMQMMKYARIGVVVVSWYPAGDADNEGLEPDALMPLILDMAHKYKLKVAIHVEPFKNRNPVSMREQLVYIVEKYGKHAAFYRTSHRNQTNLPLIYIYDSYLIDSHQWSEIFSKSGRVSVRGSELDAIFIGLLVEGKHQDHILKSGFDGFYTYFGTNGFTYGSTWNNWPAISKWAMSNQLLFIPSVGPGYVDTQVRPWNAQNTRKRLDGRYYHESFKSALSVKPDIISITSFNEWHEGTQIEPAIKKIIVSRTYIDYGAKGEMIYLNITKDWVDKYSEGKKEKIQ